MRPETYTVKVIHDIMNERLRQRVEEGYDTKHDDEHNAGELCGAGAAYALYTADQIYPLSMGDSFSDGSIPDGWCWDDRHWKPRTPRENLVRSVALIVAEIERMDRNPEGN